MNKQKQLFNMKHYFMRRLAALCLFALCVVSVHAQDGLAIDNAFRQFGHSRGCKMVVMRNTRIRGYTLVTYQSLIYGKKHSPTIASYLKTDRKSAKKIREVVDNGNVASGYYMMSPLPSGLNRYVLFSRTDNGKGALIYIEGNLSPDDIMKICYSRKR